MSTRGPLDMSPEELKAMGEWFKNQNEVRHLRELGYAIIDQMTPEQMAAFYSGWHEVTDNEDFIAWEVEGLTQPLTELDAGDE